MPRAKHKKKAKPNKESKPKQPRKKVVYMAHALSGDVENNLALARAWVRAIYDTHPWVTVLAHWIVDCEVLNDNNPKHRELGLQHDAEIIARCDELWAVGTKLSIGMKYEIRIAEALKIPVRRFISVDDLGPQRWTN